MDVMDVAKKASASSCTIEGSVDAVIILLLLNARLGSEDGYRKDRCAAIPFC